MGSKLINRRYESALQKNLRIRKNVPHLFFGKSLLNVFSIEVCLGKVCSKISFQLCGTRTFGMVASVARRATPKCCECWTVKFFPP